MANQGGSPTFRLSLMMFLQYAVWGVWLQYLGNYLKAPVEEGGLGFTGGQLGWILGLAGSLGAVTAPFLAGQVADRFINAERWLAILLIVGGAVKFVTAGVHDYTTFLVLSCVYSIAYMPTLSLTNSIAFAHLPDREKQFPRVRTWGTIGWIVASNAFPLLWLQTNVHGSAFPPFFVGTDKSNATALIADCLRVSGVLSVLYGLWAMFALPRTPPTRTVENPFAFARAFKLLTHRGFAVAMVAAIPISMIHQVYFIRMGLFLKDAGFQVAHIGPIMSIGQFAEIAALAGLGFFLKRLGFKWVIALGALSFAARFELFALAAPGGALAGTSHPVILGAMVLHGLCYGFFFAGAYVYVDRIAPPDVRHSAQTVFGIVILGVGPVLAGAYNQWLDHFETKDMGNAMMNWSALWGIQAAIGILSFLIVAITFPRGSILEPESN